MSQGDRGYPVHLVGSFPLDSAEQVFRTVSSAHLGPALARIPDGETGRRRLFILWQGERVFADNPAFRRVGNRLKVHQSLRYELCPGVNPEFSSLGYTQAALDSYAVFCRLREEGVIASGVRFQVSLPTPLNPLSILLSSEDAVRVEAAYEAAMLAELDQIIEAIPPRDLAIQWDIPYEVRVWFKSVPAFMAQPWFDDPHRYMLNKLARLGNRVPPAVELGYHLCYGDYAGTDNLFFMLAGDPSNELLRSLGSSVLNWLGWKFAGPPKDVSPMVEIASGLAKSVQRPINYIHLPVPPWANSTYLAPLAGLERQENTYLYLGLVSLSDGYEGARRRIIAAQKVVEGSFGIATECGWGRVRPGEVNSLLGLHQALAQPVGVPWNSKLTHR